MGVPVRSPFTLRDFVRESNRIEGIVRPPTPMEIKAHKLFLVPDQPTIERLAAFVYAVTPGKRLRYQSGMDVRVGNHRPIAGGPKVRHQLDLLLHDIPTHTPYAVHHRYETLHPFMDGNGRSGRVLWLWMMGGIECAPLGFLHHWYYQSLEAAR